MTRNAVLNLRFVHVPLLLVVIYSSLVLPEMRLWPPIMCLAPYISLSRSIFCILFDVGNKLYLNLGI